MYNNDKEIRWSGKRVSMMLLLLCLLTILYVIHTRNWGSQIEHEESKIHNPIVSIAQTHLTSVFSITTTNVIQVVCHKGDTIIISGITTGDSDIYDDVSYDVLLKSYFLNMINLGCQCMIFPVKMHLSKDRYVKITMIKELIHKTKKNIYWTDIDTLHEDLSFLLEFSKLKCKIAASREQDGVIDHHFLKYHQGEVKLMQGNIIIRPGYTTIKFVDHWYTNTHKIDSIVDDQWAFENLYAQKGIVCEMNFMSYNKKTVVNHFVSKDKIQLAKRRFGESPHLLSISDPIAQFNSRIDSPGCDELFRGMSSTIHIVSKHRTSKWDHLKPNYYNDDLVLDLYQECVGYQPFVNKIQRYDFVRYLIIYKQGGLYVDSDTSPNMDRWDDLQDLCMENNLVVAREELLNSKVSQVICQWAFCSKKENVFMLSLMKSILVDTLLFNKVRQPTSWITGPIRFTREIILNDPDRITLSIGEFTNGYIVHEYRGSWLTSERWDNLCL